ncbi:unnamed protein product [Sphagnum compactum]
MSRFLMAAILSGHSHFAKRLLFVCGALRVSVRNARARSKGFENSENGVHSISIGSHVNSLIYVSCTVPGSIKGRRSPWRLSIISDTFWAILNLIGSFFTTLFSLEASKSYGKKSGASRPSGFGRGPGGPGGPGGPSGGSGKGPYGGGGGAPRGLDNVRGIDHSAVPPCGSCCAG